MQLHLKQTVEHDLGLLKSHEEAGTLTEEIKSGLLGGIFSEIGLRNRVPGWDLPFRFAYSDFTSAMLQNAA